MLRVRFVSVVVLVCGMSVVVHNQDTDALTIEVAPSRLTIEVGKKATLVATVRDADGDVVEDATVIFYSRARRSVGVTREGEVEARRAGEFTLIALVPKDAEDTSRRPDAAARVEIAVTVPLPPIEKVAFANVPPKFYVGTHPQLTAEVTDTFGTTRHDAAVAYATGDASIAEVDRHGFLTLHEPGPVELSVRAGDAVDIVTVEVEPNPVTTLELLSSAETVRTGDVVRLTAIAKDARGLAVRGVPVQVGVAGTTAPTIHRRGRRCRGHDRRPVRGGAVGDVFGRRNDGESLGGDDDRGRPPGRATRRRGGRSRSRRRPAHVGPLDLGGDRWAGLRDHRHVGLRWPLVRLGRHRPVPTSRSSTKSRWTRAPSTT